MTNQLNDQYASLNFRLFKYRPLLILSVLMISLSTTLFILGIYIKLYSASFVSVFFLFGLVLNFIAYKRRARFFISEFTTTTTIFKLNFYDRDTKNSIEVPWNVIDFYFGNTKGDVFLVIWVKNSQVFKVFRSFANHAQKFDELKELFKKYIPAERIITETSVLKGEVMFSKEYEFFK